MARCVRVGCADSKLETTLFVLVAGNMVVGEGVVVEMVEEVEEVEEVEAVEVVEVVEAVVAEAEGVVVVVTAADNLALFLRRLPKPR